MKMVVVRIVIIAVPHICHNGGDNHYNDIDDGHNDGQGHDDGHDDHDDGDGDEVHTWRHATPLAFVSR